MLDVWYADGPGAPIRAPADVLAAAGHDAEAAHRVTLGWTVQRLAWIDDPAFRGRTTLAGYGLAAAVADGRVDALPLRLSAVAAHLLSDPPDVAVVSAVRRGDDLAFGRSVGWADVLARVARQVVVEVDPDGPDLGAPVLAGNVVATIARPADPIQTASSRAADDVDLRIGELVASILPDEPTLQFGPGGIGEGIVRSIDRPVAVWSGLVTDAVADLNDRGHLRGPAVAAYAWGGAPLDALAVVGRLRLASATETHDLGRLASIPRFVACNTAIEVGLDGAVNIERAGDRTIAGVGGHADFCAGAARSPGGFSVVAVRSTTARGTSSIVARPAVVSTARCDVDVVVTEHGIADLRGCDDRGRAERIVTVAAPEHRAALADARPGW